MMKTNRFKGYLYCLPALAVVAVFTIYPLARAFLMSFYAKYDFSSDTVLAYGLDTMRA